MNFLNKNKIFLIIPVFILILLIIIFIPKHRGERRVFYFPAVGSDKVEKEIRYLPEDEVHGPIMNYVDELLLGPSKQGRLSLFTLGTSCEFCFVKDKKLYVGLSAEAALQLYGTAEFEDSIKLFRKSILENFKYIDCVELFIDGNHVENR